jgi:predicted nucleic acid-binding protein
MNACFVDTSGLYAALDADDEFHQKAVDKWEEKLKKELPLVTTNYVIIETTALLHSTLGLVAVRGFTERFVPLIRIEWVDVTTHMEATTAYLLVSRKRLSLTDCVSFIVMRRLGLTEALAFDRHFIEQGFALA